MFEDMKNDPTKDYDNYKNRLIGVGHYLSFHLIISRKLTILISCPILLKSFPRSRVKYLRKAMRIKMPLSWQLIKSYPI